MVQLLTSLPATPRVMVQVLDASLLAQCPAYVPEKATEDGLSVQVLAAQVREPGRSFGILVSAWPRSGYHSHLG